MHVYLCMYVYIYIYICIVYIYIYYTCVYIYNSTILGVTAWASCMTPADQATFIRSSLIVCSSVHNSTAPSVSLHSESVRLRRSGTSRSSWWRCNQVPTLKPIGKNRWRNKSRTNVNNEQQQDSSHSSLMFRQGQFIPAIRNRCPIHRTVPSSQVSWRIPALCPFLDAPDIPRVRWQEPIPGQEIMCFSTLETLSMNNRVPKNQTNYTIWVQI